jgi:hypothetical protein
VAHGETVDTVDSSGGVLLASYARLTSSPMYYFDAEAMNLFSGVHTQHFQSTPDVVNYPTSLVYENGY